MSISFSVARSMTCVDPGQCRQRCGSDSGHFKDCHASQDQVLITKWSCMLMQWACRIQSNNKEKLLLYWNHCRNIAYIAGSYGSWVCRQFSSSWRCSQSHGSGGGCSRGHPMSQLKEYDCVPSSSEHYFLNLKWHSEVLWIWHYR